jgi:hypothetical protein
MSALSEVSILIGQRARDIEKAREIFTAEIRAFVGGILAGVRRIRSDPWTTSRVRLDLPRDIDTEVKAASDFSSQYAIARAALRFKKGTNFRQIADIRFGIEFDEGADLFAWQLTLVPAASYNRVDDVVWHQWRAQQPNYAGARHQDKANTVRFVSRPLSADVTAEAAFNDVKTVLEFLLTAESQFAEAVGLDSGPGED